MDFLLIQGLTGLSSAASLFLVAAGLTVIFGVTRVVNFAHGSLFMLGAYIAWSILVRLPRDPAWFAAGILTAAVVTGGLGLLLEVSLLRRIYRAPELFQLLATFGVMLIVQDLMPLLWGPNDLPLPRPPWLRAFVVLGGERFPRYDLILIAIGPVVLAALWLLLHRTRFGMLVRAATEDRDMTSALGIDQKLLFSAVFALGSALAGLGGALSLPDASANLQLDLSVIVEAFVVVVVGGMGSVTGAFLASVLALETHGLSEGDVLVTGATGGVGSLAITFLAQRGYLPVASTGSSEHEWLIERGAHRVIGRDEISDKPDRVLGSERWAGAVDCIGGDTLHQVLRSLRYGAAVAASGLVGGTDLVTTIYPFITRAVGLLGVDAVEATRATRDRVWHELGEVATAIDFAPLVDRVVTLEELPHALDTIRHGETRGRILVDPTPGSSSP